MKVNTFITYVFAINLDTSQQNDVVYGNNVMISTRFELIAFHLAVKNHNLSIVFSLKGNI